MIGFLKGNVEFKALTYVLIDVNNVGYKVFMTKESINKFEICDIV